MKKAAKTDLNRSFLDSAILIRVDKSLLKDYSYQPYLPDLPLKLRKAVVQSAGVTWDSYTACRKECAFISHPWMSTLGLVSIAA